MRELLRLRDFRLLFVGQAASNWGDSLTNLALLITAQRLTGSVAAVAGTAIAIALPQLVFGMLAGVYVDRWERRRVMIVSDVVRGVLVLGFVLIDSPDRMWMMYVIAFLQASVGTFFNPAKGALIPAIVAPENLLAANSTMETSRVVVGLLGTAAAGVFAGLSTVLWPIFVVDAATFVGSAFLEMAIRTTGRAEKTDGEVSGVWAEMTSGLRLAIRSRTLTGVMVGGGVMMFGLGAVNVLLVPFVIDELKVSETWFGALEGSQVASMVLAGVLVAALAAKIRPTRVIIGALLVVGLVVASMALATEPLHLMLILFAAGWAVTPLQASVSTLVQSEVPDRLRGRLGSALNTVITSANVGSMAVAGAAAAAIGIRAVFVSAGGFAVLAAALTAVLFAAAARSDREPAQTMVSPPETDRV